MKFLKINLIIFFFVIFSFHSSIHAKSRTKIIAKVGNEIITSFELENKIKTTLLLAGEELNQNNINSIKNLSMTSLINLKLKREELKRFKLENTSNLERINQHLKIISVKLNVETSELENLFSLNKIDYNEYLNEVKTEFSWQNLIFQIYAKKINLDEKQILAELNTIAKNQKKIEEFNLSEIEVTFTNLEEKEKIINEIQNSIIKFGFKTTAAKYSISNTSLTSGELGWISSTGLSKSIYDAIKKISVGNSTYAIINNETILFLKLNDKRVKSGLDNLDIEKLKNSVIKKQQTDLLNMYSNNHLSLKKNNTLIELK